MSLSIHLRSESKQPSAFTDTDLPPPYQTPSPRNRQISELKYFYVRTSATQSGACEYALATALPPTGSDTMSLVFNVSREPFAEMGRCLTRPITINKKAHPRERDVLTLPVEGDEIQRITKLLVNIYSPFSTKETLSMSAIGQYCKLTFPNLNHRESAVNLHTGKNTYRCDKVLYY